MCLIAFAWRAHRDHPLVVAGNRDESFARPTSPADWWPDRPMLAGRDLRAGGTWMGVSRSGRFAALTNYRDPSSVRADAPSRGELVGDFVGSDDAPEATLERVARDARRFNGFNLLAAQWRPDGASGMWIVPGPHGPGVTTIEPGVHALSNARLDTPWPKVDLVREGTRHAIASATDTDMLIERLFAMLADRRIADDAHLPQTGVSLDVERALSAPFIRMPGYGTRASTVFVVDRDGLATFVERAVELDRPVIEARFEFAIGVSAARAT